MNRTPMVEPLNHKEKHHVTKFNPNGSIVEQADELKAAIKKLLDEGVNPLDIRILCGPYEWRWSEAARMWDLYDAESLNMKPESDAAPKG